MKRLALRIFSALLAAVIAVGAAGLGAFGEEKEASGMKIAVLDGISAKGSAPYDAGSIAGLFTDAGHSAQVIDPQTFSARELFSADLYDLLVIPTGAAFPYSAVDNFKKFLREGGRLITSGGFAFSEMIYPEAVGGSVGLAGRVHSDSVAESPCLYKVISASDFKRGVKYTLTLDSKFESISTEKGLAHNSLYIYGTGGKLISWKDFVAVTGGSSDWERRSYTFTVPADADHIDIRLGLYISSGTLCFDNVRISGDDGSQVFFDDMENGINSWIRTTYSSRVEYSTAEGVFSSSDKTVTLYASAVGNSGCRYDVTDALRGKSSANAAFTCEYTLSGGKAGARIVYENGGESSGVELFSEAASALWHGHSVAFDIPAAYDKAYLEFYFEKSSGKYSIDEISITSGGAELFAEHDAEKTRTLFGGASAEIQSRENEQPYLAANDPESVGDLLFYSSSTVPLFDTETVFSGAVRLSAAEGQSVFSGDVLTDENGISGYSAITWAGNNRGRYQPLLYAYDQLGRKVGVAAAVFRAFYSPSDYGFNGGIKYWNDYSGAAVGFFGVTDRDLFAPGNAELRTGLIQLAETLCGKPYICSAANGYDCYKKGESPRVNVAAENPSSASLECNVTVSVRSEDTGAEIFTETKSLKLPKHARRTLRFDVDGEGLADDFYYVSVTLEYGGFEADRYETGFVVWNDEIASSGPKYTYHDNYIHLVQPDGSEKAVFLTGVDDGGNAFVMEDQTPLSWKNDFARRRDAGIMLYENLQQYRDYGDFAAVFDNGYPTERHMRTVDCAVYLAQRYGQIYMMGMLLGSNTAVGDAQLEKDKEFIAKMAARYKDVPGIIYYLNGDLVVKPTSDINALYRDFLKERYGTEEKLAEARGDIKSFDSASYDASYQFIGNGWGDIKAYDQNLFRTQLIKRWLNALTASAKEAAGEDKAVLCEFFAWPSESIDVEHAIGDITYSNIGFFDKLELLTETLANADQRVRGKSFGVGESNKRTHPDFGETFDYYASGSRRYAEAYMRAVFYNTLGMGGNHYQVWCFKDELKYSFPWGLTYLGLAGERNIFSIYRNLNMFASGLEPEYVSPEVAFLTPDSLRMSGSRGWYVGHYATLRGLDLAQSVLADNILTINENDLIIPGSVKVIYYPLAFTVPENVYAALTEFVKNGGTLYISGDPAYDLNTRKRVYGDRAEQLTGTRVEKVIYGGVDDAGADVTYTTDAGQRAGKPCVRITLAGASAIYTDTAGDPVFTEYSLGAGKVFYSAVPVEIASNTSTYLADVDLYSKVMRAAGLEYNAVTASAAGLRTSVLHLKDGGTLRVISNSTNIDIKTEYSSAGTVYSFRLGGWQTAAFAEDSEGRLVMLDVPAAVQKDGARFMTNDCSAVLVPLDGKPLADTGLLAVLPDSDGGFSCYCGAWNDPVAIKGSVYYGEFLRGDEVRFNYKGGRLAIDSAAEGDMILVCEKGAEEEAVKALLARLGINGAQNPADTEDPDGESSAETSADGPEKGPGALPFIIAGAAILAAAAAAALIFRKKRK